MTDLISLRRKNPALRIYAPEDEAFLRYARVLPGVGTAPLREALARTPMPAQGNLYVASDPVLETLEEASALQALRYGGMPIQIGCCNGWNTRLNALEYHRGSEINLGTQDMVLLVAPVQAVRENHLSTAQVEGLFIPRGTAVEVYATTMHFAPCRVCAEGFRCLVVLPRGTNTPITLPAAWPDGEDRLLWMRNKWLIAHAESIPAGKGAFVGLDGENIELHF